VSTFSGQFHAEQNGLKMYYSPFDWANTDAKIIILGITPGWTQMEIACRVARQTLANGGKVEDVLMTLAAENRIRPGRWLSGFPHPSGANGHRVRLFEKHRASLCLQLRKIFQEKLRGATSSPSSRGSSTVTAT
jgi:hypothetical protein